MEFLGIRTRSGSIVQPPTGEEMIRKFDFAFNTPGLTTGVTVYNPTVGDILLDAWIEIDTAFDGTTPKVDIGQFIAGNLGWFAFWGTAPPLDGPADDFQLDSAGLLSGKGQYKSTSATQHFTGPVSPKDAFNLAAQFAANPGPQTEFDVGRLLPAKFTSPNPVRLVVSQNGQKGGAATGATQGAGSVYFLTGTPQ